MRAVAIHFVLLFALCQSAQAQMDCTEELLACTNGCVAGGLLGALVTKGSSAAASATQSCSADCENRNAACKSREAESALRQQRIDAERAAVEARRQAAQQRQQEIDAHNAARQQQHEKNLASIMSVADKEWRALETLAFRPPQNKEKPPSEPKPSAILAAAKQLEDTDPLMARKLYLQLADRKDDYGKSANAALRRFRQAPEEASTATTLVGAPSPILGALVPATTLRTLASMKISTPEIVPSLITYYRSDSESDVMQTWRTAFGEGFSYKYEKSFQGAIFQHVSILGDLIPVISYRRGSKYLSYRRVLTGISIQGDPFNFTEGSTFGFTTTHQSIMRARTGFISEIDHFEHQCRVEVPEEIFGVKSLKVSIVFCKRVVHSNQPQIHEVRYLYLHDAKTFSEIVSYKSSTADYPAIFKSVAFEKLVESDFRR